MRILKGILSFLFSGVLVLINPFVLAEQEAEATRKPSHHEILYPVVHVVESEDAAEIGSYDEFYHGLASEKGLGFAKLAEKLGALVVDTSKKEHVGQAVMIRGSTIITIFYEEDKNLLAFFMNDYGKLVELQTLFATDKDVIKTMYYFATREVIDLRELAQEKVDGAVYLPVKTMYRVTVFEDVEPREDGVIDYDNLPSGHVDFYNLH